MRPIRVITETETPMVFHTELAEVAEAGTPAVVGEGMAVGFPEVMSDAVGCTDDESAKARGEVDKTVAGSGVEDGVRVREGVDVDVNEVVDEIEELLAVGVRLLWEDSVSPGLGKRGLVVVVDP